MNPDNYGELLPKGLNVTKGYYKRPDKTKKLFTDGWLKTGDIEKERNGLFYIVGRIKEIFKTSFGEYISPEYLELEFMGGIIEDIFIANSKYSD